MRAGVSVTRVAMGRVVITNGYKGTGREREVRGAPRTAGGKNQKKKGTKGGV
jgi:hypothetical protein